MQDMEKQKKLTKQTKKIVIFGIFAKMSEESVKIHSLKLSIFKPPFYISVHWQFGGGSPRQPDGDSRCHEENPCKKLYMCDLPEPDV